MKDLKGICAALCTPFTGDGEKVDEALLKNHLDSMLEAGVHIILVCGGTGEFAYLRTEEKTHCRDRIQTYRWPSRFHGPNIGHQYQRCD